MSHSRVGKESGWVFLWGVHGWVFGWWASYFESCLLAVATEAANVSS